MIPLAERVKNVSKERLQQLIMAMEFVPQDKLQWRPSGCAQTPVETYLQCGGSFLMAARAMRGRKVHWGDLYNEVLTTARSVPSLEEAKAAMERYYQEFLTALEELDESQLEQMIEMPWGGSVPMSQFISLPAQHTCYYCGQLNFYETLLLKSPDTKPL